MARYVRLTLPAFAVGLVCLSAVAAQACPMCNQSIAEENALPRAYMYSILFMLAMPATVFSGFGLTLFYKFKQHNAAQAASLAEFNLPQLEAGAPLSDRPA